jgi:glycosyltransferase involved in cell wall biosynthesis
LSSAVDRKRHHLAPPAALCENIVRNDNRATDERQQLTEFSELDKGSPQNINAHAAPVLSVIIPCYNPGHKVFRCIDALKDLRVDAPFEIIVVDSSDDGAGGLLERTEGITAVRSAEKLYPGTARNRGAQAARGRVLCFIDADCVPSSDWLQRILEERLDASRTAVGGAILNGTPESPVGTAEYFSELSGLLPGRPKRDVDFLPGANFALGADAFREVGGFKDYEKGSDVAFGSDCLARGIQPVFHPLVTVVHYNRSERLGFLRNQQKLGWGAGNNRFLHELPGSRVARLPIVWPLVPIARFARIMYRSVRDGEGQRLVLLKVLPWIFLGSIYFGVGFVRGACDGKRALGPGQVE